MKPLREKLSKIVLLTSSLFLLSPFSSALAAYPPNCSSSTDWEHHYAYGYKTVSPVWGVQANIETQMMEVCPYSGTSQFVNLSSDSGGWVQMGYRRTSSYIENHVYTEAKSAQVSTQPYYYKLIDHDPPTGTNKYKVHFYWGGTNATSYWEFWLNGSLLRRVGYNELGITPSSIQVTNELHDPGDQVAGITSNPLSWGPVQMKTTTTGSYSNVSLPTGVDSSISSHTGTNMATSDDAWETWDTRY